MSKISFFNDDLEDFDELMELAEEDNGADITDSAVPGEPAAATLPVVTTTNIASTTPEVLEHPKQAPTATSTPPEVAQPTLASTSPGYSCHVCGRRHPLRYCKQFRFMTAETRLRTVVMYRYCARCLAHSHQTKDCPSKKRCAKCNGDHNTWLHSEQKNVDSGKGTIRKNRANRPRLSTKNQKPSVKSQKLSVHYSSSPSVITKSVGSFPLQNVVCLVPSLVVHFKFSGHTVPIRAVLDSCGKQTQICKTMVNQLKLPTSSMDGAQYCRIQVLSAYDSSQSLTFTARVSELSHVKTPPESVPERIKDSFLGLPLADPTFYRVGRVALIFGPDLYARIVTSRVQTAPGLPVAHYTIFGWVLSGVCNC